MVADPPVQRTRPSRTEHRGLGQSAYNADQQIGILGGAGGAGVHGPAVAGQFAFQSRAKRHPMRDGVKEVEHPRDLRDPAPDEIAPLDVC